MVVEVNATRIDCERRVEDVQAPASCSRIHFGNTWQLHLNEAVVRAVGDRTEVQLDEIAAGWKQEGRSVREEVCCRHLQSLPSCVNLHQCLAQLVVFEEAFRVWAPKGL